MSSLELHLTPLLFPHLTLQKADVREVPIAQGECTCRQITSNRRLSYYSLFFSFIFPRRAPPLFPTRIKAPRQKRKCMLGKAPTEILVKNSAMRCHEKSLSPRTQNEYTRSPSKHRSYCRGFEPPPPPLKTTSHPSDNRPPPSSYHFIFLFYFSFPNKTGVPPLSVTTNPSPEARRVTPCRIPQTRPVSCWRE